MKVRLTQKTGGHDLGTELDLSVPEAEWLVYQGRAELAGGGSAGPERPREPAQPVRSQEEAVRLEDTSPVPERPAEDAPDVPVRRGPGRPKRGDR